MKIRKQIVLGACTTLGVLLILVVLLFFSGYPEGYCYFCPSIDTQYADAYSEEDFSRLTVGMSRSEVEEVMCVPLITWTNKTGLVKVFWTGDGKAPFGDFAWFGRSVEISNGVATRVVNRMYYD